MDMEVQSSMKKQQQFQGQPSNFFESIFELHMCSIFILFFKTLRFQFLKLLLYIHLYVVTLIFDL